MCSILFFIKTVSIGVALLYFLTSSQAQIHRRISRNALNYECNNLPLCFNNSILDQNNSDIEVRNIQSTSLRVRWNPKYLHNSTRFKYYFWFQAVAVNENNLYSLPTESLNDDVIVQYSNSSVISTTSQLCPDTSYLISFCFAQFSFNFTADPYSYNETHHCGNCISCFTTEPYEFLELIRPQDSYVADHFDIYCNASGYPTPDVTWFKVRGPGVVLIELRESADVYIETTYPSGCRVTSRLLLFDDSISEVLCRASQEGRSSIKEATFILHDFPRNLTTTTTDRNLPSTTDQSIPDPPPSSSTVQRTPAEGNELDSHSELTEGCGSDLNCLVRSYYQVVVGVVVAAVFSCCLCAFCLVFFPSLLLYKAKREKKALIQCKLAPSQIGNCYHLPQKSEPEDLDTTSELEDLDTTSEMDNEWESKHELTSALRLSVSKKLFIPSGRIQVSSVIGQGEFGIVYKGMMKKGGVHHVIAVKALKGLAWNPTNTRSMIDEMMKMEQFDHPNVMSLIGVCMDSDAGGGSPCIVMPFMAKGSLLHYLRENRKILRVENSESEEVEEVRKKLLQFCWQIAKGMEYLSHMKFLHRDLAARNCMIAADDTIKVADFGMAEDIYTRQYFKSSSAEKLPIKWMAPEALKLCIFSEKTDIWHGHKLRLKYVQTQSAGVVAAQETCRCFKKYSKWSFGVTCWEVFSVGENPYPSVHPHNMVEHLDNGGRLQRPKNAACSQDIFDTILNMWEEEYESRPSFSSLVKTFDAHLHAVSQYMEWS